MDCGKEIVGPVLRVYGYACRGDKPFVLRFCIECASSKDDSKIASAMVDLKDEWKMEVIDGCATRI